MGSALEPDRQIDSQVRIGRGCLRACDFHPVAPGRLGGIESGIGMLKKFLHWQGINNPKLMVMGMAPLDVCTGVPAMDLQICSARASACAGWQLFRTTRNSSPPVAADVIIGAYGTEQALGRFPQNIITGKMAVGIVYTDYVGVGVVTARHFASSLPLLL